MSERFPITPGLVQNIVEAEDGTDKVELQLKNGFKVIAYKFQFTNYDKWRKRYAGRLKRYDQRKLDAARCRPKHSSDGNGDVRQ